MDLELNGEGGSGGSTAACSDQLFDACGAELVLDLPHGSVVSLAVLTLGDAPQSPDRERLRARRGELGLPAGDDAPLLVDPLRGEAVGVQALPLHLRRARLTGIGMQANASVCRGMLRERYATIGIGEEEEENQ